MYSIRKNEEEIHEQIISELCEAYGEGHAHKIREIYQRNLRRFDDAPIRNHIPYFVKKKVMKELGLVTTD
ncbi:hypothetical protein COU53_00390 [Candidatus Pacearchaeota archaeon CG10_big_fil_rev_8_21_14_0_10_30_48]|nr:MAG: hypothetical protein COU53_00390 [Candidatus Pacearchaeota archaeon CG10_big_fil_rev_8_21_14_0_10_30_48]